MNTIILTNRWESLDVNHRAQTVHTMTSHHASMCVVPSCIAQLPSLQKRRDTNLHTYGL